MSFSFSISHDEGDIGDAVDNKIDLLPEGAGKDEASNLADVLPNVILALCGEDSDKFSSAQISGHASPDGAQVSVIVRFKLEEQPATTA